MRNPALAVLFLASAQSLFAARTRVDLVTVGPGDDLFSKFGHAALCVEGGLCYNYGTSDFSRPIGLGWEVVRGRSQFWVSVSDVETMIASFAFENRTIYRQRLPLTEAQAKGLVRALAKDALPENRAYVYNHFLENCSTRPRDHIDDATGGALRRVRLASTGTFRDHAAEGLSRASALLVPASDFLMGRWVDRPIDTWAAMFIPDVLREAVASGLSAPPEIVYERSGSPFPSRVSAGRSIFLGIVIFAALAFFVPVVRPGLRRAFGKAGGVLLGSLGALLLFAALVSALPELRRNELLLVFFPLDFFLASANRAFVRSYSTMRLLVLALVAALRGLGILVQPLWPFWLLSVAIVGSTRLSSRAYTTQP
jgi:hypothetical protein